MVARFDIVNHSTHNVRSFHAKHQSCDNPIKSPKRFTTLKKKNNSARSKRIIEIKLSILTLILFKFTLSCEARL